MGSKTSTRLHAEQHSQSPRGPGHELALDGIEENVGVEK
jgi:hypothetical protein